MPNMGKATLLLTLQAAILESMGRPDSVSSANPWGRTVQVLAEKWGGPGGTVQVFNDLKTVLELHSIDAYMTKTIHAENDTYFAPVWDACHLSSEHCAQMAAGGLCNDPASEAFMRKTCAPACRKCHLLSYDTQCRYHKNATHLDALKPGDLNRMFERIIMDSSLNRYSPKVIYSMPGGSPVGGPNGGPIADGPWVVTLDNVLSSDECAKFIYYGATVGKGFKTSKVRHHEGNPDFNATESRSSATNWCNDECLVDPVIQRVQRRLEYITGGMFPEANFEHFQILKYEEGQYYEHHLDDMPGRADVSAGHRVLTVFLYLNTVESGGGTNFRDIRGHDGRGLTIMPKRGRVLIWPSVLNKDPNAADWRTFHAGLPVVAGLKYGANVWIHQRDYRTPWKVCKES